MDEALANLLMDVDMARHAADDCARSSSFRLHPILSFPLHAFMLIFDPSFADL
jgi:hypothetical protein